MMVSDERETVMEKENKRLHIILKKLMQNVWCGFDEWLWLHQEKICYGLRQPCPHCLDGVNNND